jgi:predicted RNA-binding Zn-ribbon protein involved in translation (DUF1610 family)
MKQYAKRPVRGGPETAAANHDLHGLGSFAGSGEARDSAVRQKLMRVQIEALVSGEFEPPQLGPDLVHRLNRTWNSSGQRLHMLHVEVVKAPIICPRCGDRALYRAERRGFLQLRVYPLFGVYPWNCVSCRKSILLKLRTALCPPVGSAHTQAEPVHERAA